MLGLSGQGHETNCDAPVVDRVALKDTASALAQQPALGSLLFWVCMFDIKEQFASAINAVSMHTGVQAALLLLSQSQVAVVRP
jgi:hypothetical protein